MVAGIFLFIIALISIELVYKPRVYITHQKTVFLFYGIKTRNYIKFF